MGSNPGGTLVDATVLFDAKISNEEFRYLAKTGEFAPAAAAAPPPENGDVLTPFHKRKLRNLRYDPQLRRMT
jgi:hypothetical protein